MWLSLAVDVGDDRASTGAGGSETQSERDGRLADAAFAGDEDQAAVEQGQRHGARNIPERLNPPAIEGFPVASANTGANASLRNKPFPGGAPVTASLEVIAFANQKGGVAKTTTTLNLAAAFAEEGHRVLCCDMDPQGNLTMSQGIDPDNLKKSMYDVLVHKVSIREVIHKREVDVACASIDLAGAEIAMSTMIGRERALERALGEVADDYDYCFIDTPPSLGLLTINALTAANRVIVPVQCEYLSMRGLIQLQNTLQMIRENLNPERQDRRDPADDGRHPHASCKGGDRAAGGELRRPGLRLTHP